MWKVFFFFSAFARWSVIMEKFPSTKFIWKQIVVINDDIAWHFSYTFSKCLSAQTLHDPQTSVRDIIARYGETRISGANGLPAFTITGDIIPHGWDIPKKKKKKKIREVSRSGAQKRKARDWMLEEKERFGGVIASKVFQTRPHPRALHGIGTSGGSADAQLLAFGGGR